MLGNIEILPEGADDFVSSSEDKHRAAQQQLNSGEVSEAWEILMQRE